MSWIPGVPGKSGQPSQILLQEKKAKNEKEFLN
jgi:hypothetical protein